MKKQPSKTKIEEPPAPIDTTVRTLEDAIFHKELDDILKNGEDVRLKYMQRAQTRNFIALSSGICAVMASGIGFGWFFLMQGTLYKAVACVILSTAIPFLLARWAKKPIAEYNVHYKTRFLPQLARLLGGLAFHPKRGISSKVLPKTGIVPQHQIYQAEDCFIGTYKGIKIIFSEAHLFANEKSVFDGIFVLLEVGADQFDGHTIVTADEQAVKQWRSSRWQKMQSVLIENPEYVTRFQLFSSVPEKARDIVSDIFLKEISELMGIFDQAPISAAFFGKRYIFIALPCTSNMFEPSNIHMPVTTRAHALRCKQEIQQILSIIDILDLYRPGAVAEAAAEPAASAPISPPA